MNTKKEYRREHLNRNGYKEGNECDKFERKWNEKLSGN